MLQGVISLGQGGDVVVVAGVDEGVAEDEGRRRATAGKHGQASQHE